MPTNVSYASTDTNLESLILTTLPDFGERGNGIINSNLLSAVLNMKGAVEQVEGGLEFWYGISKQESSNFKWQGKNDDMKANSQDPSARLRWDPKIFTGSVVLNKFDKVRNRGRAAIKKYLTDLREQATDSIENQFNSAWWDESGGTGDLPESLPTLISTTPTTGTIGGLSRSGNPYLQNGVFNTAITDIGSESGIAKMIELRIKFSVGKSLADLLILGEANYAGLAGFLTTQRRYRPSEELGKLGFDVIELLGGKDGGALVGYENTNVLGGANTINSARMYGVNTKHMKLKHLLDPDAGENGWESEFERIGKSLNKAVFYNWFGNLTTRTPRAHWVATNVSTS